MNAYGLRRSLLTRWAGSVTALAALLSLVACGDGSDHSAALDVMVVELDSPAGANSGEPRLTLGPDGALLSWLEAAPEAGHDLKVAGLSRDGWTPTNTVASSEHFFVNWADFPSVYASADGALQAHWLARGEQGGYDYAIHTARSTDGGETWGEPWTLHEDDSPTEHGFLSGVRNGDRLGFTWLDGRAYVPGPDGAPATEEMSLRYREIGPDGSPGPELLVDGRVCDCCQTSAAMTSDGPVVVYRNRTEDEIRDIYIARMVDGAWQEGHAVSDDGWHIAGCPVNGPVVVADGAAVAVAWFTAPEDVARVKVAFSRDGGQTFGTPVVVDDGNPMGRVDLVKAGDDRVLVSWLEAVPGGAAEVRLREVSAAGATTGSASITASSSERASGFPQLIRDRNGDLVMAWTDVSGGEGRVRVARLVIIE